MYVLHPHSPFTPFYAVSIDETKWALNRESIKYLVQICRTYSPEFQLPVDLHLATVDRCVNQQLAASPDLVDRVVTELYQTFLLRHLLGCYIFQLGANCFTLKQSNTLHQIYLSTNASHRIWRNFVCYMSEKLASNLWHRLPPHKQMDEVLTLFQNADLLEPGKLFKNFNPGYDRDLLNGIERWTYRVLRNFIYSQIRDREPLFGLTNLGVVARSTQVCIRNALWGNSSQDRLELDIFLVQIFKNYLKRSQVRTDRLQASDWDEIDRECQRQWHKLDRDLPPLSIAQIKDELSFIGNCIRQAANISIDSLDRPLVGVASAGRENRDLNYTITDTIVEVNTVDREDEATVWSAAYVRLFLIIKQTIVDLDPFDREILELRYRDGLKQEEISVKIAKDQTTISRKLRSIEKKILVNIHQQINHPDEKAGKIESTAIAGMKAALKQFYQDRS
jgi:RNA polymerase sigma factor (sigma-70 family)